MRAGAQGSIARRVGTLLTVADLERAEQRGDPPPPPDRGGGGVGHWAAAWGEWQARACVTFFSKTDKV